MDVVKTELPEDKEEFIEEVDPFGPESDPLIIDTEIKIRMYINKDLKYKFEYLHTYENILASMMYVKDQLLKIIDAEAGRAEKILVKHPIRGKYNAPFIAVANKELMTRTMFRKYVHTTEVLEQNIKDVMKFFYDQYVEHLSKQENPELQDVTDNSLSSILTNENDNRSDKGTNNSRFNFKPDQGENDN